MPPPVSSRFDPLIAELTAVVDQVQTYEKRAGRPATTVTIALPHRLLDLASAEDIERFLVTRLTAIHAIHVEIHWIDQGPARVATVDFELPTAVPPHRKPS